MGRRDHGPGGWEMLLMPALSTRQVSGALGFTGSKGGQQGTDVTEAVSRGAGQGHQVHRDLSRAQRPPCTPAPHLFTGLTALASPCSGAGLWAIQGALHLQRPEAEPCEPCGLALRLRNGLCAVPGAQEPSWGWSQALSSGRAETPSASARFCCGPTSPSCLKGCYSLTSTPGPLHKRFSV